MTHRKLSPETYQKAFSLYEEGYSMKNVIQKLNLNCSPRTLLINYYKFKKHGIKVLLPIQRIIPTQMNLSLKLCTNI
ncbi:hypothetical protein EGX68_07945 [Staphylococcus cohnii]|nr:hypothetical protein [Staphylococcus cohnii]AYX90184.1 hypothetical protein EGX68_07945 [Staphylococcus cohnii]